MTINSIRLSDYSGERANSVPWAGAPSIDARDRAKGRPRSGDITQQRLITYREEVRTASLLEKTEELTIRSLGHRSDRLL